MQRLNDRDPHGNRTIQAVVIACPRRDPFAPTHDPNRGLMRKAGNALLNFIGGHGLRDLPRNRQWD
jgi:hypothetical protein